LPTQTLYLNPNVAGCPFSLPDFTAAVSVLDNCDQLGNDLTLVQFPTAGTSLIGTGLDSAIVVATDGSGNKDTCKVYINKVNSNPPLLNCLGAQNLTLGVNCTATL
jgi:hypothetical protein